jgi:hypothetical protein
MPDYSFQQYFDPAVSPHPKGAIGFPSRTVSTATTLDGADATLFVQAATAGTTVVVTLPNPTTCRNRAYWLISRLGIISVAVTGGSIVYEGALQLLTVTSGGRALVQSDGTNWVTVLPLGITTGAAFIAAVGTLTTPQQTAINNLVVGLKANGTWAKQFAIYPFIGGTAAAHKWNLKNPLDSDAAYRLLFVGASHQHTANGYKNTSATANSGADSRLNPFIAQTITNASYSVYSRTDGAQDSRALRANDGTYRVQLSIKWSDGSTYLDIGDQASGESVSLATTAALGLFQVSRSGSAQLFATPFASGSSISTAPALPNTNIVISSDPFGGGFTREIAYATIGQGLTLAEMNADLATINAYQTAGRNV